NRREADSWVKCSSSKRPLKERRRMAPDQVAAATPSSADPIASQPASRLPQYLALFYGLMIVYASLEPFSGWIPPLPGTPYFLFAPERARFIRFDVAINVLAYAPFGFFLALLGDRRSALARLGSAVGIA